MKKICICFVISVVCFADIPPKEKRVSRVNYVSSLLKPGDVGAEIGVFDGTFAFHVLLEKSPSKLYLIDPWEAYKTNTQMEMDERYDFVCRCFNTFENVEILKFRSEEAATMFPDEYFDYVYIDGEHSYAAVTSDLTNYFPKVKVGGYLIGDDYGWKEVRPAVQDFVATHMHECQFLKPIASQYTIKRIK